MTDSPTVFVVDDDEAVRSSMALFLEAAGLPVACFASAQEFLATYDMSRPGCLLVDVRMPGISGLELQRELGRRGSDLPVIVITGHGDIAMAVQALKAGAVDFIEKPGDELALIASIREALDAGGRAGKRRQEAEDLAQRFARLTPRERQVLELVVAGQPNRFVGDKLGISPRTVEVHRARLMEKMRARHFSELVRMTLQIGETGHDA